jgi:hypothetical protein
MSFLVPRDPAVKEKQNILIHAMLSISDKANPKNAIADSGVATIVKT